MSTVPDTSMAVYFADDDAIIECTACDPDAGEPADWPAWTDAERFACIDPDPGAPGVEPTPDDVAWLAANPSLPPISPAVERRMAALAAVADSIATGILTPPVAGGSPFEPTDADWDEAARWAEHLDRVDSLRREDDHQAEVRARFG
jgi:hypothetical protein